jgi:ligand-binding SRPBCC domain-containing protein
MPSPEFLLITQTKLPVAPEDAFSFFSDASNLKRITPPSLGMEILSPMPIEMKQDAEIQYRIRLYSIPLKWKTRITVWDPPTRFVDVQERGPYREWIHEHLFAAVDNGVVMTDRVRYQHFGGKLINRLFVAARLNEIFDYRARRINEIFSETQG